MEEYYGMNDFMSSINGDRKFLEDIVFNKIKKSIEEKTDKICVFNIATAEDEITSFYLDKKEYNFFLSSYLKACESREEYEICTDIIEMRKLLWKKYILDKPNALREEEKNIYDSALRIYSSIMKWGGNSLGEIEECIEVLEYFEDYEKCKDLLEILNAYKSKNKNQLGGNK